MCPAGRRPTVVAAALGECAHVAGINRFLRLAEQAGWRTVFLGPAVPISEVISAARREEADLVGVSYRLTPDNGAALLAEFVEEADELRSAGVRFAFGGTPPVVARARQFGFFEKCFDGTEPVDDVIAYLKGEVGQAAFSAHYPQTLVARIAWKSPYPLIRHHFGLPTVPDTEAGIAQMAESRLLDVISLGIDQDAQENFFHPERQDPRRTGAGGVPVRSAADYRRLYAASRRGNYPLMRTYAGTDDFIRLAEMYRETINIAWGAIPLFWFNQMDGRGPWDLEGSIREHQAAMRWHGEQGIPLEVNEPHHWGMRDAPDVVYVVSSYLAAYNARAMGVRDYIAQFMFNSPSDTADWADLAKMIACLKLIESLSGPDFHIYRQTRTGLLSYPVEPEAARGQLAASIYLQMALKPEIIHVVGYTEADHVATAHDVIASCRIARQVIATALAGQPDMTADPAVQQRASHLVEEAQVTLAAIQQLAGPEVTDPLTNPATLARAVTRGILDAPQLQNNRFARGQVVTRIVNGGCQAVDPATGRPLSETERLAALNWLV